MTGGRLENVRSGESAELLAEFILAPLAFKTRVPIQDDVGHDLLCSVMEYDVSHNKYITKAGPVFTVQVKSNNQKRIVYEKKHAIDWLKRQDNPFFICLSNSKKLCIDLYSTWNTHNAFLYRDADRFILELGKPIVTEIEPQDNTIDGKEITEMVIPLGPPALHITAKDAMKRDKVVKLSKVLKEWIEMDQRNIVNRRADKYRVTYPINYKTNETISELETRFFEHPKNIQVCIRNFCSSAVALRSVIRYRAELGAEDMLDAETESLDRVLEIYDGYLNEAEKSVLKNS